VAEHPDSRWHRRFSDAGRARAAAIAGVRGRGRLLTTGPGVGQCRPPAWPLTAGERHFRPTWRRSPGVRSGAAATVAVASLALRSHWAEAKPAKELQDRGGRPHVQQTRPGLAADLRPRRNPHDGRPRPALHHVHFLSIDGPATGSRPCHPPDGSSSSSNAIPLFVLRSLGYGTWAASMRLPLLLDSLFYPRVCELGQVLGIRSDSSSKTRSVVYDGQQRDCAYSHLFSAESLRASPLPDGSPWIGPFTHARSRQGSASLDDAPALWPFTPYSCSSVNVHGNRTQTLSNGPEGAAVSHMSCQAEPGA
jgi:hypothetical protein